MDFNILSIGLIILAIALVGYLVYLFKKGKKKEIYSIVKSLVDEAEIKFGSGTGDLKYDYVVGRLYQILPSYIKMFISEKLIDLWIETAVNEMQEFLNKKLEESHS